LARTAAWCGTTKWAVPSSPLSNKRLPAQPDRRMADRAGPVRSEQENEWTVCRQHSTCIQHADCTKFIHRDFGIWELVFSLSPKHGTFCLC
jgi:hypothetical protein